MFLDTFFLQALVNRDDEFHQQAIALKPLLRAAEVWVTEAVLIEIGDAFSRYDRFIWQCYQGSNIQIVSVTTPLIHQALELYEARPDKDWGLTDCLSFVVMQDKNLTDALTGDHHFRQAGFRALLLDATGTSGRG